MAERTIHLGFEVGTGAPVAIPLRHLAVTGQTQESGKTTTLEALVARMPGQVKALAFVTKRGEGSFADGRRIQPYFRDRADWQFVTSIIDATLQEKNKFLRPWIMKICRTTKTLAEVHDEVRKALRTAKGMNEGVYTQLDAYLDLIVPEIRRTPLAERLELNPGLNVMDVGGSPLPMQMLFVQSAIDWVNAQEHNTVVVVPEAWEMVPEGKGSPVKASAVSLVRKGAAIGNWIWVDSQDMAGVDKVILRGCAVWLIGVQRETNEIKRNLDNIPDNVAKPSPKDVALLERGQFYACWGKHAIKTYVQPAWMQTMTAQAISCGANPSVGAANVAHFAAPRRSIKEVQVNEKEARELRETNARLHREVNELRQKLTVAFESLERYEKKAESSKHKEATDEPPLGRRDNGDAGRTPVSADEDALFNRLWDRFIREKADEIVEDLLKQHPKLTVQVTRPALDVEVTRETVTVDGTSLKGRIARLIAQGFFREGRTQGATRTELKKTGSDVNAGNLSRAFTDFVRDGFLRDESEGYIEVSDMKVNIVEAGKR